MRDSSDLFQGGDTIDKICSCNGHKERKRVKDNSKVFGATGRKKLPLTDIGETVARADLGEGQSGVKCWTY